MKQKKIRLISLIFLCLFYSTQLKAQSIIAGQHGTGDYFFDVIPDLHMQAIHNVYNPVTPIDINGDGIIDFELRASDTGAAGYYHTDCYLVAKNNNQVAISYIDSCYTFSSTLWETHKMAQPFFINAIINGNAIWEDSTISLNYDRYENGIFSCAAFTFNVSGNNCLGVRLFLSTDTLYGWINVVAVSNTEFTLKEYACNSGATSIEENQISSLAMVYPNPITNQFSVKTNNKELSEIILCDIASKKISQQKFISSATLNTEQLANGIYLYEVRNKNGVIKKGKVVKD